MTSYRNAISDAIRDQLIGKTIAGEQVFSRLDRPIDPEHDLPAIAVFTMASTRGRQDYGNTIIPRMITVAIEAAVSSNSPAALAAAEDFADQIEDAMEADPTLGGVAVEARWRQSVSDVSSHGSVVMGVCIVEYDVEIMTRLKPDNAYEFGDDGFVSPPGRVETIPDVLPPDWPAPPAGNACGPDGCDIPAWGGEVER